MEIVRKKRSSCRFDEIEKGQCFINNTDLVVYMRMQVVNTEYTYAAVDITTGQIYAFDPDATVVPIEARVEIE